MQKISQLLITKGSSLPLGTSKQLTGINFSFAPEASSVELFLILFNESTQRAEKIEEISLSKDENKTGDVWHIALEGLPDVVLYAYKISHVDDNKVVTSYFPILDPYAKEIISGHEWNKTHCILENSETAYRPLCVF